MVAMIVGAIIGYFTNWLAIKMLFWPHRAHNLFGLTIPFTPGLFVKRRSDFALSISNLIEDRFAETDDLVRAFFEAQESGMIDKFLKSMGPIFRVGWNMYASKTDKNKLAADLASLSKAMHEGHVISKTIDHKIETMSTVEIESLIMAVVRRELRAITWLGALIGASIGAGQSWL